MLIGMKEKEKGMSRKYDTIDYCSVYSRSSKKAGWQVIGEKKEHGDVEDLEILMTNYEGKWFYSYN